GLNQARYIYTHAITKGYRFYSYGDACLLRYIPQTHHR
ncbi:MAG: S-adenosylmethionine:tRNA ribosyltransferase-isomerase, partial [Acetobacter sp.]|nr:S-adenosylmethionine:tRNA ribosyltransferase-isomerase [Acetobacter sp.]